VERVEIHQSVSDAPDGRGEVVGLWFLGERLRADERRQRTLTTSSILAISELTAQPGIEEPGIGRRRAGRVRRGAAAAGRLRDIERHG